MVSWVSAGLAIALLHRKELPVSEFIRSGPNVKEVLLVCQANLALLGPRCDFRVESRNFAVSRTFRRARPESRR